MAGAFRIAEGYVEVTADESGYDRAIDRLKSKKNTVKIGVDLDDKDAGAKLDKLTRDRLLQVKVKLDDAALAKLKLKDVTVAVAPKITDAAYNRVKAQLDRLTAERTVNIRASVDTRVGANEIRNLTQRRTVRIGLDVDTRVAADSIANLTRRRTMTVQARADTTDAANSLRFLARDRTVNVRTRLLGSLAGLNNLGSGAGGSAGGVGILSSRIAQLVAVAVGALPTVASLAQSIAAMGPAAALAAPAVLSLGAAFAVVKLGTSGIGDAFKAAFTPAVKSASQAESATRRVESAQRSLAKAQQAVKDAEVNAAEARVKAARDIQDAQQNLKNTVQDVADSERRALEQVESAERDLADAQRASKKAQEDLNTARKEAKEDLEDLNNRLTDAQLDERQKVLDLQDAQQNLDAVKAKGAAASQEDLDKAQLQYDQAQQALKEQQTELQRLQDQTDAANKAGVEGSEKVQNAKQNVADANQQIIDKTQELKDAELDQARTAEDGAQRIAKAQRDVADAQAAAAKAATDGARQIADAQENAREAAEALAEAQNSGAAATAATAVAMAKLAPAAQAFVSAVLAQREAWRSLKLDVQNALFQGLGQKFTQLSTSILPSLHEGLTGTADILNTTAKNAANAVIQLAKAGQLRALFDGLNAGMRPLTRIPGQIITGLSQISIAASPAFARLTTAAANAADEVAKKLGDAFKSGALQDAIEGAVDIAKQFGRLLGDIGGTLNNIFKAAAAGGGDALGTLGSVFSELRRITAQPEVQKSLTSIFTAVNAIAKLVAGALGSAIEAALPLLAALAPFVTQLANQLGPVIGTLLTSLGKALTPIINALLPVLGDVADLVIGLVRALTPLLQPLGNLIAAIIKALGPVISAFSAQLMPLVDALVQALTPAMVALVPVIGELGTLIAQLAPMFPQLLIALIPLIPAVTQLVIASLRLANEVLIPLMPLIVGVAGLLTTQLATAIANIVTSVSMVITFLADFSDKTASTIKSVVDSFTKLWTQTKSIFTSLKTDVSRLWSDLWTGARSKWNTFWSGLRSSVSDGWSWMKNSVTSLKTSITNTWSSMWSSAKSTISSTFSTINGKINDFKNGMKSAFSNLRDSLGTIWNGIKSRISGPVKWVVSNVYNNGIRKMWNTIAGKVNSKLSLPSIALGFNRGGVVPGTGNSDTVPAMLTPGERILSKPQVAKLGGHKGIDAILGEDRPTKTGGNPSRQEEKRRYQGGTQHYASGGIVGSAVNAVGSAIGGAVDWAKDLVIGGLKAAAQKAISSLIKPLIGRIPGGDFGGLLKSMSSKALDSMLSFLGNEDKKAVGGPAVQRALAWVKTQNGLPYQWAGNGNPSWDCSGLMSAIESVIRGEKPHRRWATGSFVGSSGPPGWVRNLKSPFMIGITNAGVGHTAGTLAGMNVESSGGRGVHMGPSARGYNDSLFTSQWGFAPAAKYDSGGLLQPGATLAINKTRKPEAVLTADEHEAFRSIVTSLGSMGSGMTVNVSVEVKSMTIPTNAEAKRFAQAIVVPIKEELRKYDRARA